MRRLSVTKKFLFVLGALVVVVAVYIVVASGDDTADNSSAATGGERGGALTYLASSDVDFIDPGLVYSQWGFTVQVATNRTLYSYKPSDPTRAIPDLAAGPPQLSRDRKSVTVKLRRGVRFSPPVDREVKAKDIKYAFERAFTKQVPNDYATVYFADLAGIPKRPHTTGRQPISGIETPDEYTLVFRFTKPTAAASAAAMVLPITSPVPQEYARQFDAKVPSKYDQHAVFTGPYMVRNDKSGKLVGRKPGQLIELVRNPNWRPETDFRPAYLDAINIQLGNSDLGIAARRVLEGSALVCCDAGSPPADVQVAVGNRKDQLTRLPAGSTRWVTMRTDLPPFDNLNVRKAVIAAFDRTALHRAAGGGLIGKVASGWIPPGMPGFEEAGGERQNSDLDYLRNPKGDMDIAKRYMLKAKAEGVPVDDDGKYIGGDLLAISSNIEQQKKVAQVSQAQFAKLGFKVDLRPVPQDALTTKFCGVPAAKVPICTDTSWAKDYPDPQTLLDPTFNGKTVDQASTGNYSLLDDPRVNESIAKAVPIPVGPEREKAWAKTQHFVAEAAPGVPWMWDGKVLVTSEDVRAVGNSFMPNIDLSFTSLK